MAFQAASNDWTIERFPAKGSTTYTAGAFIVNDLTDNVMATASSKQYLRGILQESKTNAAATTTSLSMQVPTSTESTFYGDMVSGEVLAATNVGAAFDFSATGLTISTNTTYKPVTLVKFISTSRGLFKINYGTGVSAS